MSANDCLSLMEREDWEKDAACRGMDPNVFFPNIEATYETDKEIALRVCSNCPVRAQCRSKGRTNLEEYGIWGGEDDEERYEALGGADSGMTLRSQQRGFWEDE